VLMPRTVKYVFSLWWKVCKDRSSGRTCVGRLFQRGGPAAGNAQSPRRGLVSVKLSDDRS